MPYAATVSIFGLLHFDAVYNLLYYTPLGNGFKSILMEPIAMFWNHELGNNS